MCLSHSTAPPHDYHDRQISICYKIRSLLITLANQSSKYDQITPKIEYWIEYVFREDFATVDQLVEGVSGVAWERTSGSYSSVGRFLKEFHDAPHRSEPAKSFVSQLCHYVLRWFAIASTKDLYCFSGGLVSDDRHCFTSVASFVGYLIKWELFSHELVRRHLTKCLTNHHDHDSDRGPRTSGAIRARAVYSLLTAGSDPLLRGLLEPDDVRDCFSILDAWCPWDIGFNAAEVKVECTTRAGAS